jgi:hypothetical protein
MARGKQNFIKGTFTHRRTEADYMTELLEPFSLRWNSLSR